MNTTNHMLWNLWSLLDSYEITIVMLVFGALLGSLYNVLIYRLPENTLLKYKRSHCRHCHALVPFWLNIPILSYLFLRGKTACCNKPLSVQYPIIEAVTAVGCVAIYHSAPFVSYDQGELALHMPDLLRFAHRMVFCSVMLIGSVIDIRLMIIPNELTLGLIITSVFWMIFHPELSAIHSIIGILAGGGIPFLIIWLYWIVRKQQGMGMGDVKLLAGVGGWLGWQALLPTLFSAAILGSIVGMVIMIYQRKATMQLPIPFGPFLSLGAILFLFTGHHIVELTLPFIL